MPEAKPVVSLTGRVAIITGAARGLGRAAAERMYELGASVAVNVRDAARSQELATTLGERALVTRSSALAGWTSSSTTPRWRCRYVLAT